MNTSKPYLTSLERQYLLEAFDKGDIGKGDHIWQFEESWANYNKYKYGVACNSGTSALHLALLALGIGPGDEVIVPEFTMVATAWAVTYTGATPVFIDCLDDLNMDPNLFRRAINKKTKAVMVVPIYGRKVSDMIYRIAESENIPVVEDMAEAHGIMPRGDIACYSFHASKIITTGGGGMCLTNNISYSSEMAKLTHLYLDKDMTMLHQKIGYNYRLSNIQAAIGLAQVERIDEILEKRKQVEAWYDSMIPSKYLMPERDVVWVYDIDCKDKQEETRAKLADAGIESRYFFKPMSMQPVYETDYQSLDAYKWSKRGLYIPLYPEMTKRDVEKVCKILT
jgi:dTDP-4-amino-4,6-dideoxygalactose transaminase